MHDNGGIFFVKKGWTIAVAVASSDFWIVIVVVMGHTSKMDLASAFSQTASRIVVLETTARKAVRGKVGEQGHRLHSLSSSPRLTAGDVVKTVIEFVLLGVRIPDGVRVGNKQDNHYDQNESV